MDFDLYTGNALMNMYAKFLSLDVSGLRRIGACKVLDEMADRILQMKKDMKMRTSLSEIGCTTDEQIREISKVTFNSALVNNNPVPLDEEAVYKMFNSLK